MNTHLVREGHVPGHGRRDRRARTGAGFTLMETALAVVIVGTGVLASLQLFSACTMESKAASDATTARMLAENIRETMANLPFADPISGTAKWGPESGESVDQPVTFDDVDDFDGISKKGVSFSPPLDATRLPIAELSRYTQFVTVMPVNPNDPAGNSDESAATLPKGTYTGAVRVRVRIQYRAYAGGPAKELYTTSWVRAND